MPRHKRASSSSSTIPFDDDDECSRQGEKPGQRNAANARERARMRILSKAFSRLKTTLPWVPPDTKLSKLDTLRLATSYIAHLRTILTDDGSPTPIVHPLNLTWPFTIQQQTTDHSSRSGAEDWSSEEQNQSTNGSTAVHLGLVPGDSPTALPTDADADDAPRHFHVNPRTHHHESYGVTEPHHHHNHHHHHHHHHRHHYSDSLLNIG